MVTHTLQPKAKKRGRQADTYARPFREKFEILEIEKIIIQNFLRIFPYIVEFPGKFPTIDFSGGELLLSPLYPIIWRY